MRLGTILPVSVMYCLSVPEILVVDLLHALGGETAELATARERAVATAAATTTATRTTATRFIVFHYAFTPMSSSSLRERRIVTAAARAAFLLFLRGLRHRRRLGHGFVHVHDEVTQHRIGEAERAGELGQGLLVASRRSAARSAPCGPWRSGRSAGDGPSLRGDARCRHRRKSFRGSARSWRGLVRSGPDGPGTRFRNASM